MIVIDASVTLAWALPDEQDAFASTVLEAVAEEGALVPSIWALEVGNALLMAVRRKRLTNAQFQKSLSLLRDLPIRVSSPDIRTAVGTASARQPGFSHPGCPAAGQGRRCRRQNR